MGSELSKELEEAQWKRQRSNLTVLISDFYPNQMAAARHWGTSQTTVSALSRGKKKNPPMNRVWQKLCHATGFTKADFAREDFSTTFLAEHGAALKQRIKNHRLSDRRKISQPAAKRGSRASEMEPASVSSHLALIVHVADALGYKTTALPGGVFISDPKGT